MMPFLNLITVNELSDSAFFKHAKMYFGDNMSISDFFVTWILSLIGIF